jgi:Ca2+-binding EF-hand superfamily protein
VVKEDSPASNCVGNLQRESLFLAENMVSTLFLPKPDHLLTSQPPKRKAPASAVAKGKQPAKPRRSKLAQENDITAEDEHEIKEAWQLFSQEGVDGYEDEKEGVIRTQDVRKCMTAQGFTPANARELAEYIEILDPENEGYVTYGSFVAVCALKINQRGDESTSEEVEEAYRMFTRGTDGPINIHHLRKIAKDLKEDIGDDLLKHMILEANGGTGVNKGVGVDDFREVMMRAGVFQ